MDLSRQRAAADQENRDLVQRLQAERDQNEQSANVITSQMSLIDSLKAKVDALLRHAREGEKQGDEVEAAREQQLAAERIRSRSLERERDELTAHVSALETERGQLRGEVTKLNAERDEAAAAERRKAEAREKEIAAQVILMEQRQLAEVERVMQETLEADRQQQRRVHEDLSRERDGYFTELKEERQKQLRLQEEVRRERDGYASELQGERQQRQLLEEEIRLGRDGYESELHAEREARRALEQRVQE
eukprot:Hpha_TRINITY_DN14881_c0_g2::TRINITY_DN14881_c0_g2_i1::g.169498::m.169498